MRYLKIILAVILFACYSDIVNGESHQIKEEHTARITYFTGTRVACQKAKFAKEGVTVAAHPKFKFGTKLYIPDLKNVIGDGNFIVQDRGPAVTSKVASKGKALVFDIYVSSRAKISKFANKQPMYMKVYVLAEKEK